MLPSPKSTSKFSAKLSPPNVMKISSKCKILVVLHTFHAAVAKINFKIFYKTQPSKRYENFVKV